MTPEDKELLLKDLSARLPYRVKCYNMFSKEICELAAIELDRDGTLFWFWDKRKVFYHQQTYISEFKPYLFPLSRLYELDRPDFYDTFTEEVIDINEKTVRFFTLKTYDWLNAHHYDYRGLIEKGLAIDATGKGIY